VIDSVLRSNQSCGLVDRLPVTGSSRGRLPVPGGTVQNVLDRCGSCFLWVCCSFVCDEWTDHTPSPTVAAVLGDEERCGTAAAACVNHTLGSAFRVAVSFLRPVFAGPMDSACRPCSTAWPLSSAGVRLSWLQSCCAVAEGADVSLSHTGPDAPSRWPPAVCVSVVLGDALHRVAVLGGREGMPRSLGSVYGGSVTRFLGGGLRGVESRVIAMRGVKSDSNGVAVSRDGSTLLVADGGGGTHAIHEFDAVDGSRRRIVGGLGDGPLQFKNPRQVWIAPDDFVFVADYSNNRVQVLTPSLDFHAFIGVGHLNLPAGVCANADVIMVSVHGRGAHCISVFNRRDGTLLRRFGCSGSDDGQLHFPHGLCFSSGHRHVAVADFNNYRVSVFSLEGEFVRHVGVGVLKHPQGVACSAFGELVVADWGNKRVVVFGAGGEMLMAMGRGSFTGVAMHRGTIFALDRDNQKCFVFK
jgi:DNA-binding beta-propeller fold protein YncE